MSDVMLQLKSMVDRHLIPETGESYFSTFLQLPVATKNLAGELLYNTQRSK